jgi:hypothetical protein
MGVARIGGFGKHGGIGSFGTLPQRTQRKSEPPFDFVQGRGKTKLTDTRRAAAYHDAFKINGG